MLKQRVQSKHYFAIFNEWEFGDFWRYLVDWNVGGDSYGNSKWLFATKAKATGAPSGSTRTERSEGEGWSRARGKRPPEWKSTD
ncbi:hypothetical protein MHH37_14445 [Solibacillus sp. FSL K6-1781]|uniref:hypothetical protein n=1 Tax=Solibacillus sp. FSL K6-1781 TaxID=2921474 RepID=UPI00315A642F